MIPTKGVLREDWSISNIERLNVKSIFNYVANVLLGRYNFDDKIFK